MEKVDKIFSILHHLVWALVGVAVLIGIIQTIKIGPQALINGAVATLVQKQIELMPATLDQSSLPNQ